MKKFLSVVLCLALLMSLLFVVPASAVTNDAPYFVNDFESGVLSISGGDYHKSTLVEGGAYGSKYCVSIAASDRNYGSNLYKIGTSASFSFEAEAGDVLRASMLVKITTPQAEDSKGQCSFILHSGQIISNDRKYHFITSSFDKTETDWQKVDFTYTFSKDFVDDDTTTDVNESIQRMEFRMNSASYNNKAADGTTNCTYLVDDIEIYLDKNDGNMKFDIGSEDDDTAVIISGDYYDA